MVILIVETDPNELQSLSACIHKNGHKVFTTDNVKSALKIVGREPFGLVLFSLNSQPAHALSFIEAVRTLEIQPPVIVTSRRPTLEDAIEVMKGGAHDFWPKPVSAERLIKTIQWLEERSANSSRAKASQHRYAIITQNAAMLRLKAMARKVAASNASIFLQGESGTGKEMFARFIHDNSERKDKPLIALNCAALPESLMESELFGHEKGAFTGAIRAKEGKFELAHTGTLFLDEVTEIPLYLQPKLLRVLQEGEVDRVGGKYPIPVDVRIITSTNVTMEEALRENRFRKDLYYRLNVIPLKIPPLRDRREDIGPLCTYFTEKYNQLHKCSVDAVNPEALRMLEKHPWPGNVRELENVIQRAMLLSQDKVLTPEHLIFDEESASGDSAVELMAISEMEKILIHKALDVYEGNRTRAAEILGISVRTLRNKLNEYRGLDEPFPSEI